VEGTCQFGLFGMARIGSQYNAMRAMRRKDRKHGFVFQSGEYLAVIGVTGESCLPGLARDCRSYGFSGFSP